MRAREEGVKGGGGKGGKQHPQALPVVVDGEQLGQQVQALRLHSLNQEVQLPLVMLPQLPLHATRPALPLPSRSKRRQPAPRASLSRRATEEETEPPSARSMETNPRPLLDSRTHV